MQVTMEHRMTEVEERSKSNQHRLDEVEKKQDNLDKLVGTVKVLADREKRVEDDVREIKCDVKSLTEKPAKQWDDLVSKIIWAVISAALGFMLAQIGM